MPKINQTSIERIESEIGRLREIIANSQAEIRELETAAAILRRLEGGPACSFADKKIRECATILLREKSPQHFKAMAREAIARGYRSQKGGDLEVIAKSFWSTMSLFKNDFEKTGTGCFKLKSVEKPGASVQPGK